MSAFARTLDRLTKDMGADDVHIPAAIGNSKPRRKPGVQQFLKVDSERRRVFGVALEADVEDSQGDIVSDQDLEDAACKAVLNGCEAGVQHQRTSGVGKLCASFPLTTEIAKSLGIDLGGRSVWLIGLQIEDPAVWDQVKKGEFAGFSIGGTGTRVTL
ncbi:MAG: XkdF-like putative serine protease domain-containing protein [Rhodospirillaceae bacterium]